MKLVRHVFPHFCAGSLGGVLAAVGLIATNVQLRALVFGVNGGWLGTGLLVFGCVATFAPAAVGCAIMQLGASDD